MQVGHRNAHAGDMLRGDSPPPPQVVFGGDPEAALIQYTANDEARRAISCTEAVLNNRFIRVYWHRENSEQHVGQSPGPSPPAGPQHAGPHKVRCSALR